MIELRVLGETTRVPIDPPCGPTRLQEMLPAVRALDDAHTAAIVRGNRETVTCAKGCSACCRIQPVPVTPSEAYALLLLVEKLEPAWRSTILSRFADGVARLDSAGLARGFLAGIRPATEQEGRAQARRYLDLQLACPFLEDDACSIYPDRPFACREYLVTTPSEYCAAPLDRPVRVVPGTLSATDAFLEMEKRFFNPNVYTLPLIVALEYARKYRAELEQDYPGDELLRESIRYLFRLPQDSAPLSSQ